MLIDTHAHLTFAGLIEQVDAVLTRARDAGVHKIITVAVNPGDAQAALPLLAEHPELYLIAGVHPHEAQSCDRDTLTALRAILRGDGLADAVKRRIVGVGETGLDFHYNFSAPAQQEKVFEAHLELAAALDLPVVIHARESESRVCDILAGHAHLAGRVVFHCFSAEPAVARRVLDFGGYCSFTGVVTFRKSAVIQEAARYVPASRMMLETDAPYLTPEPVRKIRPNEPGLLVHTARFLADLRGEKLATLAAETTANATRFFRLPEDEL
jgi:TatD DNase family protein